jgi:exosortase
MLIFQLSTVWEISDQYSHGYLVPILCFFLLIKTNSYSELTSEKKLSLLQGKTWLFFGIPLILTLPFLWIVRVANSDWRLLNIVFFSIVFIITIIPFYDSGGWKRTRYLIFPICFFIVAIPWPLSYDLKLTQYFQERVSSIIVDILLIMEHEASLQGTVIDVGIFGQIGIDQACSGINGLQSSIVVSLFLGAYYKFKFLNRLSLIIGGVMVAIAFNLLRAFSMSFIKVKGKGHLLDEHLFSVWNWNFPSLHDLAGWIETLLILITIIVLARSASSGLSGHSLNDEQSNWNGLKVYPNVIFSTFIIITATSSIIYAKNHFESTEENMVNLPSLKLNLDDSKLFSEELPISKQITAQLHYEDARSIQWQDRFKSRINPYTQEISLNPNYEYWQLFEASWDSGGACTAILSTHSPDSCLPLTGFTQVDPRPGQKPKIVFIDVENYRVSFEAYEFIKNQTNFFVFRCFWPKKLTPGQPNVFPRGGYSFDGRINSAFEGRRNVGGTMLALALANVDSRQTAINKLQALANQRLSFGIRALNEPTFV